MSKKIHAPSWRHAGDGRDELLVDPTFFIEGEVPIALDKRQLSELLRL
jgi:hypothetical protein